MLSKIKYVLISVIMVGAGVVAYANAESYYSVTIGHPNHPWLKTDNSGIPMDEIFTPSQGNPMNSNIPDVNAEVSKPVIENDGDTGSGNGNPGILWGTDRLVRSGGILTFGRLSMDDNDNGDMYVAVLQHVSGTDDTIRFYVSSDGITWTEWPHPIYHPDGDTVYQVELLVGPGANPWIYSFCHSQDAGTPNTGAIILRRLREDGSTFNWVWIAMPGDSLKDIAVDIDASGTLYLSYMKRTSATTWGVYGTMSTDEGLTWSTPVFISDGDRNTPEIAIGNDNYFYIAYVVDDSIIRIGRNDNGLSGAWNFEDVETDGDQEYAPSVAASRVQAGASQTAWVLYRNYHSNTGNYDIHYAYTTNGGTSWSYSVWPPANFAYGEQKFPWVHTSLDYPYDICVASSVAYPAGVQDSIITVWASSSDPTSWQSREIINDYEATIEFAPRCELNIDLGGTAVVYRQYGSGLVWFDYWWNIGVEETSKAQTLPYYSVIPQRGGALIKFSLPYGKMTKINLYSPSGRNLKSIEKYFDSGMNTYRISIPKTGVYFIKIDERTTKIITLR